MLVALNVGTEILEAVGASLSLLEELNRSQSFADDFGYTPSVLCGNHRQGRTQGGALGA